MSSSGTNIEGIDVPVIMTVAGPQPTPPATLQQTLITNVAAVVPGYTADLPGSLIEDVSSTEVAGLAICDSGRVEAINSLSPFGANAFIIQQYGVMLGILIGLPTNTSVFIVFSGSVGFPIPPGFLVTDGNYQYRVQDGGIIASNGSSAPLFCIATVQGTWAVPSGTVAELVTSVPSSITLSCTNPQPGLPGIANAETEGAYRQRVQQALLAASTGMSRYLKTLLGAISGVQSNLISVQPVAGVGYKIIVGGGDPYEVGNAIWEAVPDTNNLVGSTTNITAVTEANPGVATTSINHGFTTGQADVNIAGALGMTSINGGPYTVTVITPTTFSFGVNTTAGPAYTGGGVATPNTRNITVDISDYPDSYPITFVNPPAQAVTVDIVWNTDSPNFVSDLAVAQTAAPQIAAYINSIFVGQPMNLFVLQSTFQQAIASIIDPTLLTRMVFTVEINAIAVSPESGTGIIAGDSESYFETDPGGSGITITQG
jgi:hypothetical protein